MYEHFYGIEKRAFSLTPDPRFLVMTPAHREVKASLMYAILAGKGFTVLTGDAGTGKTTLLRAVINSIPAEKFCFSFVVNPTVSPDQFYDLIAGDFGLATGLGKPELLRKFLEFLLESRAAGRTVVLFIDEAHRLSIETLEEIRLLTNYETESEKLLHIVLAGQDELGELLDRRELRQLKQRVEIRQHIGPLSAEEVPMYIHHRWTCAGGSLAPFSEEAVRLIAQVSGCIPRLINTICDNALTLGFAEGASVINEKHIAEVSRDLRLTVAPPAEATEAPAERPPSTIELNVPPPSFLNGHRSNRFSLFGNPQPKQSWWHPSLRAEKA
jgi:general secretion pathway protein A